MCTQWSIKIYAIKKMIVPFAGKQKELEIHLTKNYKPDSESQRRYLYGIEIYVYAYRCKAEKRKGTVVEEEGSSGRRAGETKGSHGK